MYNELKGMSSKYEREYASQSINFIFNNWIMKRQFHDSRLEAIYLGTKRETFHPEVIRLFRRRIRYIDLAPSFSDIANNPWLYLEKLRGDRKGLYSIRLNKQRRLIFELLDGWGVQVLDILELSKHYE